MAEHSRIEWCDHTFNPWIGCTKVSPGCDHCYAEAWDRRFAVSGHAMRWGAGKARTRTSIANWRQPLKWNAQAEREGRRFRVFCASLADVFDNAVPESWRFDLLNLIADTANLDWLLLTKRIGNAQAMLDAYMKSDGHMGERWDGWSNVWLGATVVDQAEADRDVPKLLAVPARVRFLSIEPMLGPISIERAADLADGDGTIDWVIAGGESGPGARPAHPDWFRALRDECDAFGVPFLFKQWGEWAPFDRGRMARSMLPPASRESMDMPLGRPGKKAAGRLLDGVLHDAIPSCRPRTWRSSWK